MICVLWLFIIFFVLSLFGLNTVLKSLWPQVLQVANSPELKMLLGKHQSQGKEDLKLIYDPFTDKHLTF